MAEYGGDLVRVTMKAAGTLDIHQIVRFAGEGMVNVASHAAAAYSVGPFGVVQHSALVGDDVPVGYIGESKVRAGAAVTPGRLITTNSSGRAVHAGSGDVAMGRAMTEAGADGEIIRALLFPVIRLHGAAT